MLLVRVFQATEGKREENKLDQALVRNSTLYVRLSIELTCLNL